MDEQENVNLEQQPVEEVEPKEPEVVEQPKTPVAEPEKAPEMSMGTKKAGFGIRLLAFLIDVVVLGAAGGVLGGIFYNVDVDLDSALFGFAPSLLTTVYLVVMDVEFGATLGKMALKLKVVDADTGENLDWGGAILREFVGRAVNALTILIGYLWITWDKDKQGLHDKIGNSYVIKEAK